MFDQNVVFDLEFMGGREVPREIGNEIIQIGAVRLDTYGSRRDTFRTLVKPTYMQWMPRAVGGLTGITMQALEEAPGAGEALGRFRDWIGDGETRLVTWGDQDMALISATISHLGLGVEMPGEALDLQRKLTGMLRLPTKSVSLVNMSAWMGLEVDPACLHDALYDSVLTSELFAMALHGRHKPLAREVRRRFFAKAEPGKWRYSAVDDAMHASVAARGGDPAAALAGLSRRLRKEERPVGEGQVADRVGLVHSADGGGEAAGKP